MSSLELKSENEELQKYCSALEIVLQKFLQHRHIPDKKYFVEKNANTTK